MKTIYTAVLTGVLVVPFLVAAHIDHPPGAPAHPIDSPEYHEVAVTDTTDAPVAESRSVLEEKLALLLQLISLLQLQLELLTGESDTNTVVDDVELTDCSMDAFMCSDGSYVGRTGPSCEFICPDTNTSDETIEPTGDLTMTTDSTYRYFVSGGLPEYDISDNRYASTPSTQDHDFRVPLEPVQNDEPTYYTIPYAFGIALNGVTFEPFAAEWYQDDQNSGWQEDPFVTLRGLDIYNAHVQPSGLYHYHGQPTNLIDNDGSDHSPVIGFAADGFPLYGPHVYQSADDADSEIATIDSSYQLRSGTRPSGPGGSYDGTYNEDYEYAAWGSNSLDECNGRFGVTPEFPEGTYYYVATESFPYIPRCLMGDMDSSFAAGPGGARHEDQ